MVAAVHLEVRWHHGGASGGGGKGGGDQGDQSNLNLIMKSSISVSWWK